MRADRAAEDRMRIERFRIHNYKGFLDAGEIPLSPGFNVVVGRNNAGKTALVEALGLAFANHPHRSTTTVRTALNQPPGESDVTLTFGLSSEEFRQIRSELGPTLYVRMPKNRAPRADLTYDDFMQLCASTMPVSLTATYRQSKRADRAALLPDFQSDDVGTHALAVEVTVDESGLVVPRGERELNTPSVTGGETLPLRMAALFAQRVYLFRAERLNVAEYKWGDDRTLRSDAGNLPEVLHRLQEHPLRFPELNELVRLIFPDIAHVGVETIEGRYRVMVWPAESGLAREDLAVSLRESGTGIGQVLAMLYVVLTSDFPRTIVIDEPQSFLHPGAVRKLFDVLRTAARHEHQYVVTTHSPTVITAAEPRRLLLVRKEGAESVIEAIDASEAQATRRFLEEIGAAWGDAFGAEAVLWVEGPTEQACFPHILERLLGRRLFGIAIVGVRATGELEGRHARAAYEIYRRLSGGPNLVPRAVGFVFDREGRSQQERDNLVKASGGTVHFLPRLMYENYLLHPAAITAVAAPIDGFVDAGAAPLTAGQVNEWMEQNGTKSTYLAASTNAAPFTELWYVEVDGARLLEDLFNQLSGARVEYLKVDYGEQITQWILEHAPDELRELAEFLDGILGPTVAPRALRGS
jgi:predicted ATPase